MTNKVNRSNGVVVVALLAGIIIGFVSRKLVTDVETAHDPAAISACDTMCNTCYPGVCSTIFDGVGSQLAKAMVKNYRDHHLAAINANCQAYVPNGDSRAVWFSLEKIKRFVYEIEHKICDSCKEFPKPELGVRIYFAEYPLVADLPQGIDPAYAGMHTLLMVPTFRDGLIDRDFDPAYIGPGCAPRPMDTVGAVLTALSNGNNDASAGMRNHGSMYPPPYPTFSNANPPAITNCAGADFLYYVDGISCSN